LSKFAVRDLKEPRDVADVLHGQEVYDWMKDDFYEPSVLSMALNHDYTAFNMFSQGSQTLAKTNS